MTDDYDWLNTNS